MNSLSLDEKAALLAGLLDGDGYVGGAGSYISLSYSRNTVKGRIIDQILSFLDKQRYIRRRKYRGKPHYEQVIRFSSQKFMHSVINAVFHKEKRKRLIRYNMNYLRAYECKYTVKELEQLLQKASSAYIDRRAGEKRNAAVLVLYIHTTGNSKRVRKSIKITSKCKENLAKIVKAENIMLSSSIMKTIERYLNTP